ncbi:MAG: response regulator, partial [Ignavibacteria bacterium]|nr:response regulator [Ignavibacteria bacterium]
MTEDFHILIVDDDDELRSALVRELAGEGYTIYEAGDGEKGLAVFRENDVDLVLLDINLPTIDG